MEQLSEYVKARLGERSTKAGAVFLASIGAWYGDVVSEQVVLAINAVAALWITLSADKSPE